MTRPKSPDEYGIPSLAEYSGNEKSGSGKPSATRHLLFIRHGQYAKAEEDEKRVLTKLGRFVAVLVHLLNKKGNIVLYYNKDNKVCFVYFKGNKQRKQEKD